MDSGACQGTVHKVSRVRPDLTTKLPPRQSQKLPGGTVVKNPPAKAGDMGSIPGLGRSL